MIPADMLQDRKHDGLVDFLNAQIYVSDQPTIAELAAAANIAARLAFEAQSMSFPVGFAISDYDSSKSAVAIIVGSAAALFVGTSTEKIVVTTDHSRSIIAILQPEAAELFARTLETGPNAQLQKGADENETSVNKRFSLATLFTSDGLLGDGDGDRIPERIDTTIVLGSDVRATEVIDLAARIALEAAGVKLPLVVAESVIATKGTLPPNVLLVGHSNRHLRELCRSGQYQPERRPEHGRMEILHMDGSTIVIVEGPDTAGERAILRHAAQCLPFVWKHGKHQLHLSHIEEDFRRFFARRSPAGQAAAALYKGRTAVDSLATQGVQSGRLQVLVDGDCRPCLDYIASQFPGWEVTAANLGVHSGPLVFEDVHQLPWEGDDALGKFASKAVPSIRVGSVVTIDLRVSESLEVRQRLALQIQSLVRSCGADVSRLTICVISAHKQAYSWLDEILKPRLRNASQIRIFFREPATDGALAIESKDRWLHELYPIDEVLSRDLAIPLEAITFHQSNAAGGPTYEVLADDASGQPILHETFEPRFSFRPMFDVFPDYAVVRVDTGWLHAVVDGIIVADERIETDPERFWDVYQRRTLPEIRNYILKLYEGEPRAECAPHFAALEVELWLSEPDSRIGIDEERISTLEALHEDIYFTTLLFFDLLGLNNPGRIIPRVHPARDGEGGLARIRFTGKAGPNPSFRLTWTDRSGNQSQSTVDLLPTIVTKPQILAITVRSNHSSIVSLEFAQTGISDADRSMLQAIQEFHKHGVGRSWLSYENVDQIKLGPIEIHGTSEGFRLPQIEPLPITGTSIVQTETPISPAECETAIRRLAGYPEVRPFHAGTSYLGRPIWVLDVVSPSAGTHVSQAKASVLKPVLFITGRQHANEVSSTTHILQLAERLVCDSEIRKLLDHVNFVLQPITNPDGAALVDELHKDTPDFMLHAGYWGALGMDVTQEQWCEDPQYPEAHVRPDIWRMWLPDIVLNPHGYPSHEWVQLFAGYTAWVKSRSVTARDWWIPRGWFIPGFTYMEESRDAALSIHEQTIAAVQKTLGPWHDRMRRRYMKYCGTDSEPPVPGTGLQQNRNGFSFMQRYPGVTTLEIVSETPDEVAHGDWLKTLTHVGLEFSLTHARYLAENHQPIERTTIHGTTTTVLRIFRKRP